MKQRLWNIIKYNGGLLLIFIAYYIFNHLTGIYIPCVFYSITGLKCPGCGITHCLFELLHFNFEEAFNHNQLVFIGLPFFIAYYIYANYLYLCDKKEKIAKIIPKYLEIILIVITIIFGIIRNF